ncbi:hypothetical protein OIU85_004983 [Salix viminalis]|uniref:Uncharacterized protein n=1 Tax=Salix viminalis TaxID=40686 RepID=A0A9Q0PUE7_SALVM|nr:hypothetical protein OIU85_004983 [Salix viminalis]
MRYVKSKTARIIDQIVKISRDYRHSAATGSSEEQEYMLKVMEYHGELRNQLLVMEYASGSDHALNPCFNYGLRTGSERLVHLLIRWNLTLHTSSLRKLFSAGSLKLFMSVKAHGPVSL